MSSKLKGMVTVAAFFLLTLLAVVPRANAGDLMYGDADLNGGVDGGDLGLVQQCVSGVASCPGNADATGNDCKIAASDVFALQRYLVYVDLPVLPARNPGVAPGCWAVGLAGPASVSVGPNSSVPVTVTLNNNVAPPRGELTCAGVTVDFTLIGPPGCSLSPSPIVVTDGACNATVILNAGPTEGAGTIGASVTLLSATGSLLATIIVNIPFDVVGGPECTISDVTPATGCPLDLVTITGSGFGPNTGTVAFDGTGATITSWGDNSIVVSAPGGDYSNVTATPIVNDPCSLAGTYSYDNQAPTVDVDPLAACYTVGSVSVSATCADVGSGVYTCSVSIDGGANWFGSPHTYLGLPTGPYTAIGWVADNCGNTASDLVGEAFAVDVDLPTVNVDPLPACDPDGDVTVSATCGDVGSGIASCEVSIDGGGNWFASPHLYTGLTDGNYLAIGQATDNCGNTASDLVGEPFEVDTVAVVIITDPEDGGPLSSGDVSVSGTADLDIATVTVTSDQGHSESSPVVAGSWSVTLMGVIGPSITITAQGTDNCGIVGSDSVTLSGGGDDCMTCHSISQGSQRQIVESGGSGGDFNRMSHHVTDGTTTEIVTVYDCVVCHSEGYADASINETYHENTIIDLKDADTEANIEFTSNANETTFCLTCHDSDGATLTYVPAANGGNDDPLRPYNSNDPNTVLDVESQFSTSNFSSHAISTGTPMYSCGGSGIHAAAFVSPWEDCSTTECGDCHHVDQNAHGTENNRWLLEDINGSDITMTDATLNCFKCHTDSVYTGGTVDTVWDDHGRAAHQDGTDNSFGIWCLNCHGGGNDRAGSTHGTNQSTTDDGVLGSYDEYRFLNGASFDYWFNPNDLSDATCSTWDGGLPNGNNIGCNRHTEATYTPQYIR